MPTPIHQLEVKDGTSIRMLAYGTGTAWYKSTQSGGVDRKIIEGIKTAIKLGYITLTMPKYITKSQKWELP
ncbi:MAG: hypothetical protein Q9175_002615 [Cornicularia normoerica]